MEPKQQEWRLLVLGVAALYYANIWVTKERNKGRINREVWSLLQVHINPLVALMKFTDLWKGAQAPQL